MKTVSASVACQSLPELLGAVTHGSERVVIERHGRPVAALISLKEVEAAEDTKGPEWDELAQVLPELNTRLDRMIVALKTLQRSNQAFRKEMDRLHTQRRRLVWRS
ncbi:MAG: type II toxin-antitoxin system Phd/YefM family antitoxin [Deltaproteobacteria bacterium]|nr:type II toxin-antitoxin system Phd/YefM family antitoxin [Deltaproteobacteria bacterium]